MTLDAANAEPEYLGFWARFVAFLIDSTAASIIMAPLAARFLGELTLTDYDLADPVQRTELLYRLTSQLGFDLLIMRTIFILFWVFKNATPGKMLFKSVIVDAKTFAAPSTAQNIVRYLAYFVSLFPFGLGFIWIGFDARKQGWHDKIAGTVVIKGKPRTSQTVQDDSA